MSSQPPPDRDPLEDPDARDARLRDWLKDELWGQGVADDRAEAWIARWEAEAAPSGVPRDDAFWRAAFEWIDRERGAS